MAIPRRSIEHEDDPSASATGIREPNARKASCTRFMQEDGIIYA